MKAISGLIISFWLLSSNLFANDGECAIRVLLPEVRVGNAVERTIIHGTGTVIDKCNDWQLIVTACHLFDEKFESIICKMSNGREVKGTLVDFDETLDLAAVLVPNVDIDPVNSDDNADLGNEVVGSGLANDLKRDFKGKVTEYAKVARKSATPNIDIAVMEGNNPGARQGDSGGPILKDGKLVGVISGSLGNKTFFTFGQPLRSFIGRVRSRTPVPVRMLPQRTGNTMKVEMTDAGESDR